ncbi:hypothetical protein [Streptomyces qinglanensis]|uniref:hypothetical protein n=1 Tax=Streptomyces qinglanensis TaxID=943816 RepID=UPI003D75FBA1
MRRARTAVPSPTVVARTTAGALILAAVSTLTGCMTVQGADDAGEGTVPVGSRADDDSGATEPEGGLDGTAYRKGHTRGGAHGGADGRKAQEHERDKKGKHAKRGEQDDKKRSEDRDGSDGDGPGEDTGSSKGSGSSGSSSGSGGTRPGPGPTGGHDGSGGAGGGHDGGSGTPTDSPSPTPTKPDPEPSPTRTTASPSSGGSDTFARRVQPSLA